MRLESEESVHPFDGELEVAISITNRGRYPVWLYSKKVWGPLGTLDWKVLNARGEEVESQFVSDDWMMPGNTFERDPENLERLVPGGKLEWSTSFPIDMIVPEPGDYHLGILYSAPLDWDCHEGIRIWTKSDGQLLGTISFEVMQTTSK